MFTVTQMGQEVVHEADHTGVRCSRCLASISKVKGVYQPGHRVVVVDCDATSSWRTIRRPNC